MMLKSISTLALLTSVSVLLAGCASAPDHSVGAYKVGKPYTVAGRTYYPNEVYSGTETGMASWYGPGFNGKRTANGEVFDEMALTAAHPTLQMPSLVRVTNLQNNRSIVVRVNDRGPFHGGRVMDVSKGAAEALGFRNMGTTQVQLDVLGPESMALAQAAKQGVSTNGAEIAMNETGRLDDRFAAYYPTTVRQPEGSQSGTMLAMAGQNPVSSNSTYSPQVPEATALQAMPLGVAQNINQPAPIQDTDSGVPAVAEAVLNNSNAPIPPQMPVERVAVQQYQMAPVVSEEQQAALEQRPVDAPVPPKMPKGLLGRLSIGVNSAEASEMPAQPKMAQVVGSNFVQVGAYLSHGSAAVLRDELAKYGPTTIVPARPGDNSYFRVRIGPLTEAQADSVVDTLKDQGRLAMVVGQR